jgi:hypothetical protein
MSKITSIADLKKFQDEYKVAGQQQGQDHRTFPCYLENASGERP